MREILVGLLLGTLFASGCAWTLSPDRSRRISDCLARCQAMGPDQTAPRAHDPNDPQWGLRDSRTECERACHAR